MDPDPILLLQRHASLFGHVSGTLDACSFAVESLNQMHLPKNPAPKIPTEMNRSRIWIEFEPQGERDQEGRFHYFTSQGILFNFSRYHQQVNYANGPIKSFQIFIKLKMIHKTLKLRLSESASPLLEIIRN